MTGLLFCDERGGFFGGNVLLKRILKCRFLI